MPVTVGKIEELARHFHGEGGASLSPPYGIYLPGREPPSHTIFMRALCTASQQNEPVASRALLAKLDGSGVFERVANLGRARSFLRPL
jgi:hypothetical protein